MVYLLTRSARYYYDWRAIAEPLAQSSIDRLDQPTFDQQTGGAKDYANGTNPNRSARKALENVARAHRRTPAGWNVNHDQPNNVGRYEQRADGKQAGTQREVHGKGLSHDLGEGLLRNKRSVWTIATQPYPEAHFATFPEALIEPMILAGTPPGGVVLDPFGGSGTVALVAERLQRKAILIDLSAEYVDQALHRIAGGRAAGTGAPTDLPIAFAADGLWAAEPAS
jgi:hypothetical protein